MRLALISTFLLFILISQTNGANILFFIGVGSYSHRVPIQPLMDALAERGHNVTMLSGYVPKVPNPKVREFTPKKLAQWVKSALTEDFDVFKFRKNSEIIKSWFFLPAMGVDLCENLYADQDFIKWMTDPSTKFDVVVWDILMNECAYGMAHHFRAKLVAFNTGQINPWQLESHYGIPDETSSLPDAHINMPTNMNIFQRAATLLWPLVWKAYRELWFLPKLEEVTKQGLGLKEIPSFVDIEANTSLILANTYWAQEFPRSLPPNVIPIGGIAMSGKKESKPLPKKIEDFIQKGKDGFIYVSFGTLAEFTRFDPEVRQEFVSMISKFPNIQFIWKSTYPIEEELPSNVMVEKWLPQADILGHPKIRLFVTHGGLGGIYEAIHSKVPMVCFPVFAEQDFNADLIVLKGYGIKLEVTTLKEPQITEAMTKILTDPSYKRQVEKVSKLLSDRPVSPLDSAVWWLEFILRHDNLNEFMRPLSATQSWWVRRQLDAWALVVLAVMVAAIFMLLISYAIIKLLLKIVSGIGGTKDNKKSFRTKNKQQSKMD